MVREPRSHKLRNAAKKKKKKRQEISFGKDMGKKEHVDTVVRHVHWVQLL